MYCINIKCSFQQAVVQVIEIGDEWELLHRRMAHLGIRSLTLLRGKLSIGVKFHNVSSSQLDCIACLMAKLTRQAFECNKATRGKELLQSVHNAVNGHMSDISF